MQSHYPEQFDREMGCTVQELLGWLPQAMGESRYELLPDGLKAVVFDGQLRMQWTQAEPRQIALISMPRLHVSFRFKGLSDAQRYAFMKRFDLYTQRGGG